MIGCLTIVADGPASAAAEIGGSMSPACVFVCVKVWCGVALCCDGCKGSVVDALSSTCEMRRRDRACVVWGGAVRCLVV